MVCSLARLATGNKMHPCFLLLDDGDVDVLPIQSDLHQAADDLHSFPQGDGDSLVVLAVISTTV